MPEKTSYLDPIIKQEKKKGLGPQAYSTHSNWNEESSNIYKVGHLKKGKFSDRERPLVTKEYMDAAKRRDIPAPNAYKLPPEDKPRFGHSDRADKSSYHLNMAIHQAKQAPSFSYKTVEALTICTKPKVLTYKLHNPLIKKEDLGKKVKKDTAPDMGSYEPIKA